MITPDTLITAELLAGLTACPFCGAGKSDESTRWKSFECYTTVCVCYKANVRIAMLCERRQTLTLRARVKELEKDCKQLQEVAQKADEEICQTLGKALGYPWFKDDPKNFPESTEADGVCVGDHCGATLALEMVDRMSELETKIKRLTEAGDRLSNPFAVGENDIKAWIKAKEGV